MKKIFTILIVIALAVGIFAMRQYNMIQNGIQRPIPGLDAFFGYNVIIDDRVAVYQWSENFTDFDPLEYNIPLEGNENIFRSPKNDNLMHLVYRDGYKSYGIEFYNFEAADEKRLENMKKNYAENPTGYNPDLIDFSPYNYRYVLETIYNIRSADDIESIKVSPSNRDNTPEGMGIQKRIGVVEITDRAIINDFYNAVTQMSYSHDRVSVPPEDFTNEREISFTLVGGTTINKLRYYHTDGRFFEYGLTGYTTLPENIQQRMAEIFKITDEIPELPLDATSPSQLLEQAAGIKSADDVDYILVDQCFHNPLARIESFTISDRQTVSRFYEIVSGMAVSEPNDGSKIMYGVTKGQHLRSLTFVGENGEYTLCYSPWTRDFHNDDTLFEKVSHEIRKEIGEYLNIPSHIYGS